MNPWSLWERLNYAEMKLDEAILNSSKEDILYWRGYRDAVARCIEKEKADMKKVIAGCFKMIQDCEDESKTYAEFPDGLRLIFRDGVYVGWYLP